MLPLGATLKSQNFLPLSHVSSHHRLVRVTGDVTGLSPEPIHQSPLLKSPSLDQDFFKNWKTVMMWSTKLSHFKCRMSGEIGCLDTNKQVRLLFLKAPCVIWCRTTSCGIPWRVKDPSVAGKKPQALGNPSVRRCWPICRSGGELGVKLLILHV